MVRVSHWSHIWCIFYIVVITGPIADELTNGILPIHLSTHSIGSVPLENSKTTNLA